MSGLSKGVKLALGYVSIRAIAGFVKSTTKLASDLTEVQNVVDVTFAEMSKDINDFADIAINQFGLSELSAKKYSSSMGAMLKSSGIAGEAVRDMAVDLTKLSADMASFYNLANDDAFQKILSGMSGMTRPLKELGINMNIANVEAFALSKGIKKSWQQMSQAEQTMARYQYLMSVTSDAQGDFSRNTHTWANQTKILSQQFDVLKGTIGAGFINALMPIVKIMNALIKQLQVAAQSFKALTTTIFGDAEASSQGGVVVENLSDIEDGLDGVSEAAKKAKKALAGFDEINTISSGDFDVASTSTGTNAITGADAPEIKEPDTSWVDGFKKKFNNLFDFSGIKQSWANLKAALTPLSETVGSGLKWLWDNVLVPFSTWVVNSAVPAFFDALSGALSTLNSVIGVLKPLGKWLWDSFLQPIAGWTGGVITKALDNIAKGLKAISDWIKKNQSVVEVIAVVIGSFAAAWGLVNAAILIWNVVGAIAAGVTTAFGAAVAFLTSPIGLVVIAIGALIAIVVLLVKNWDKVKAAGGKAWDWIKGVWNGAANWMNNKVIKPIGKFFSGLWDGIKAGFVGFINFVIRGINTMIKGFLTPVNLLIKGWNATVGKATAKIPEIKVAIPEIPKLASGGIISGRSIVEVGEYANARSNPEIISPLDKLKEMIADVAGGDIYLTTSVVLDDGTLVGSAKQKIARGNRLVGKPIMGV